MTRQDHLSVLDENNQALQDAMRWLKRSYGICRNIDFENLTEETMDALESLTSRFSRLTDLLFSKVFRSIMYLEQGQSASWIDTLLAMEKKGLIDSGESAWLLKEIRNDIVHEYILTDLIPLYREVLDKCPVLLDYSDRAVSCVQELREKIIPR